LPWQETDKASCLSSLQLSATSKRVAFLHNHVASNQAVFEPWPAEINACRTNHLAADISKCVAPGFVPIPTVRRIRYKGRAPVSTLAGKRRLTRRATQASSPILAPAIVVLERASDELGTSRQLVHAFVGLGSTERVSLEQKDTITSIDCRGPIVLLPWRDAASALAPGGTRGLRAGILGPVIDTPVGIL
jgi:hypothetical protein